MVGAVAEDNSDELADASAWRSSTAGRITPGITADGGLLSDRNARKLSGLPHHQSLDEGDFALQPDLDARKVTGAVGPAAKNGANRSSQSS